MDIAVLIKQVPVSNNVSVDPETHALIRASAEGMINPADLNAIEEAMVLKEQTGNNPMHAGQWDPDKLPATGGTDDYFIDFLLDQLEVKVPGIVDSGLVSSWLSYRAEPKDFLPILGETPVEGYILATGYGGNGVIEAPAASRDLAKLIMRGESTPLLEDWAFKRLL